MADPAEGDGGDAEERGNVLLRDALNNPRVLFHQVGVALGRCIADRGVEQSSIIREPPKGDLQEKIFHFREFRDERIESFALQDDQCRGFDALDANGAGFSAAKAVD